MRASITLTNGKSIDDHISPQNVWMLCHAGSILEWKSKHDSYGIVRNVVVMSEITAE